MRQTGVIAIDEYYHIYNRGVDKRIIFHDVHDYNRFLLLMYLCNSNRPVNLEEHFRKGRSFTDMFHSVRGTPLVAIGAWCLMPNHFHFLCKEIVEGGTQKFFHKVCTGYSMYFNTKYQRTGTLFEGRYKSQHIDSDRYLRYLYAYIYLNPVKLVPGESSWKEKGISDKSKVRKFLNEYDYSSMPRVGKSKLLESILSPVHFPRYYESLNQMEKDILEWLSLEM